MAQKFQSIEKKIYVPHTCMICFSDTTEEEKSKDQSTEPLFANYKCGHTFHRMCIGSYLADQIRERKLDRKCPSTGCSTEIEERHLRKLLENDLDILDKYFSYKIENFITNNSDQFSCCPTAGCRNAFFFSAANAKNYYYCKACSQEYCLNCRSVWHYQLTCKEYKSATEEQVADELFQEFIAGMKCKQCSKCKYWVEKTQGCNHMTCRCAYEFCYLCGGVYRGCSCPLFSNH